MFLERMPLTGELLLPGEEVRVLFRPSPLKSEIIENFVASGLSVAEILDEIVIQKYELKSLNRVHVELAGEVIPKEWWTKVRLKSGTTLSIVVVPGNDIFKQIAAIAVTILASIVAPFLAGPLLSGLGIAAGSVAATLLTGAINIGLTLAGSLLLNALFPTSVQPADNTKQIFSISGAQNQANPFGSIPVILGKHRVSPLYAASPFTEISGDDQYLRMLFCVGYGPLSLTDLKIGETAISDFKNCTYEIIENHLTQPVTLFTEPVYEEQLQINLVPSGQWSLRTTAEQVDELSVDISFPNGVVRYAQSDGSRQNYTVGVTVQYRPKGTTTWLSAGSVTITANSAQALRRTVSWVPASRGQFDVQVAKTTGDYSGSDAVTEQCYWTALRGRRHADIISFTKPLTLVAMRIKATNELSGTVNTFNCVAASKIKVWNGSSWVDGQQSSNPAAHFRHVLQGYGNERPKTDAEIDLVNLQQWHDYCAANGYTFNLVCEQAKSVYDRLRDLATAGRAAVTFRDGKWGVVWDVASTAIVQHFTPRNSSAFKSNRAYADLPHAFRVTFINASNSWQSDERIVYADGYTVANATKFEGMEFVGITDPDLIWRHARYHLAQAIMQRETYTLQTDFEHLVCMRGDRVRVNHDVVLWGNGSARVKSTTTSPDTVTVDDAFTIENGKTYTMRFRRSDGTAFTRSTSGTAGTYKTFTLSGSGELPAQGCLVQFGEVGYESVILRVKSITALPDFSARLDLVDDAPNILLAETGPVPPFVTGISTPIDYQSYAPRQLTYIEEVQSVSSALSRLQLSWLPPEQQSVDRYILRYRQVGSTDWISLPTSVSTTATLNSLTIGTYEVGIRAVFRNEQLSGWLTSTVNVSIFAGTPPDVTGFLITVTGDNALLEWDAVDFQALSNYQIRFSPLTSGATWAASAILRDNVTGQSAQVASIKGTYLIKAVSYANRFSNSASLIINGIDPLTAFNAIQDVIESPSFAGTFDKTFVSSSSLRLATMGDVFNLADYFSPSDYFLSGGGYQSLGYYYFSNVFDLGAIYTSRLSAAISAFGEQSSVDLFGLTDYFTPSDYFGYAATALWDVTIEVATTNDNPTGSPTWSSWSDLVVGDKTSRAFKFRARLESRQSDVTPVVSGLTVSIDMPDRVVAQNDLAVTVAGRSITFAPSFRQLQGVSIAAQGLQTGDYYEITGKTNAGFTIIFKNSSGSAVARTFDYVAKGYGYLQ